MTYTITPDSPKALKARVFGDELTKALRARDIPLKELAKAVGIGHTAIWYYTRGGILPKTPTALAMAAVLDWPKLGAIVLAARTFACGRPGCPRTYVHEGGGPRRYCTPSCQQQNQAEKQASRRLRQAGQTDTGRHHRTAVQQLRAAARIADERAQLAETAIDAMCKSCEPEGLCRDAECPLRALSPFPLREASEGEPRTHAAIRVEINRKAAPARRATMLRRHAEPGFSERLRDASVAARADWTPEHRADFGRRVSEGRRRALAAKAAS
jgi:transcriptional regulator with XRE-family HTH domain